jgi:hypothetical protein
MNGHSSCFSLERGPVYDLPLNDDGNNMLTRVSSKNYRAFTIIELEVWEVFEIEE